MLILFLVVFGLKTSLWFYPLSPSAFWYGAMVSLRTSCLDEMLVILLLMFSGMLLSNNGGWLLWLCTERSVLLGFMYDLSVLFARLKVTSKKLTMFLLASIVIFRVFDFKILLICCLISSISLGFALQAIRPSFLYSPILSCIYI